MQTILSTSKDLGRNFNLEEKKEKETNLGPVTGMSKTSGRVGC